MMMIPNTDYFVLTDDLISYILSYCTNSYDEMNHIVVSLLQQQQLLSSSSSSLPTNLFVAESQQLCPMIDNQPNINNKHNHNKNEQEFEQQQQQQQHEQQSRWNYLPIWYELFRRDGYALDDDDIAGRIIPVRRPIGHSNVDICGSNKWNSTSNSNHNHTQQRKRTNYRDLYQYRRNLQCNLFGLQNNNNTLSTCSTTTFDQKYHNSNHTTTNNNNKKKKKNNNIHNIIAHQQQRQLAIQMLTTKSPKVLRIHDLLSLSNPLVVVGQQQYCVINNPITIDNTTTTIESSLPDFEFQVISNATGTSLGTLDHSIWRSSSGSSSSNNNNNNIKDDDRIMYISTLTLFPMLLQPPKSTTTQQQQQQHYLSECDNNNNNNRDQIRHEQDLHSIVLLQRRHDGRLRMRMLPCQQYISEEENDGDGNISTIIGCSVQDDGDTMNIEFRFWKIISLHVVGSPTINSSSNNDRKKKQQQQPQSTIVSVKKFGFCRINGSRIRSATFRYFYPYRRRHVTNEPTGKIYMTTQDTKNLVHEFRIHPWHDDDDKDDDTVEVQVTNRRWDYFAPIETAERMWEIPNPQHQARWNAGVTTSSDGSVILVLHTRESVQLWNMTTTTDITYIPILERLHTLIETYFHPDTLLHSLFIVQSQVVPVSEPFRFSEDDPFHLVMDGPFTLGNSTPYIAKHLPIDKFGFFTYNWRSFPIDICLPVFWEFDCVTSSWQISSIINLPLNDIGHFEALPQIHYDGQRFIVLGHDNLGYVILVYQILRAHGSTLQSDHLNQQFRALNDSRERLEESGGVYNFPDRHHFPQPVVGGSGTSPPTPKGQSRIQFRKHIRHEAFGNGPSRDIRSMQMSCNERFLLVRIIDEKRTDDRIVFFDLDSSEFDA